MRDVWNNLRGVQTTTGTYASVYHPGAPNEWVTVIKPDGSTQNVKTPALLDWFLAAEDGALSIYYHRDDGNGEKSLVRVPTSIPCGVAVGAITSGGTGPIGPAGPSGATGPRGEQGPPGAAGGDAEVDNATIERIAAAVVSRLFSEPPAPDHFGLPEYAQFGSKLQEYIAVMAHAGFLTHVIANADQAVAGMIAGGYTPKTGG